MTETDIVGVRTDGSALSNRGDSSVMSWCTVAVDVLDILLISKVELALLDTGVPGRIAFWGLDLPASAIVL